MIPVKWELREPQNLYMYVWEYSSPETPTAVLNLLCKLNLSGGNADWFKYHVHLFDLFLLYMYNI